MSETTNYKLHLTDDGSERFIDWREKMNGTNDSNMIKIDTALGEKADKSVSVEATLLANAWVGSRVPYTQELSVEGLAATQNGIIDIAHEATAEQREMAREAMLAVIGQETNKLILAAYGEVPESDIPVYIIILG